MVLLKCPRKACSRVWDFKGKARFFTTCPRCKTSMSIVRASKRVKVAVKNPIRRLFDG